MEAGSLQMPDIAPTDDSWDSRTRRLLGDVAAERLAHAKVAVIGTGGVGGYAVGDTCKIRCREPYCHRCR